MGTGVKTHYSLPKSVTKCEGRRACLLLPISYCFFYSGFAGEGADFCGEAVKVMEAAVVAVGGNT